MTRYCHSLGILHLDGTHSKQQSHVPLAPQRVVDPHSLLWAWSIGRGHSVESWNSDDSSTPFSPLHWKHAPLGLSSDQSSSWPLTSAIQHLVLGLLSGLHPNRWHAFQLELAQWQHIPPSLCYGHPQPWQVHPPPPSRWHPRLLHPGQIAQPLGQGKW